MLKKVPCPLLVTPEILNRVSFFSNLFLFTYPSVFYQKGKSQRADKDVK